MLDYLVLDSNAQPYGNATVKGNTPEHAAEVARRQPERFFRGVQGAADKRFWSARFSGGGWWTLQHKDWV